MLTRQFSADLHVG